MINCALEMCYESVNELQVGIMMSLFPFPTSVAADGLHFRKSFSSHLSPFGQRRLLGLHRLLSFAKNSAERHLGEC
jgi:hypothetical protein